MGDRGLGYAYHEKFYFDTNSKQCEAFIYGGAGGNGNRFNSMAECQQECGSSSDGTDYKSLIGLWRLTYVAYIYPDIQSARTRDFTVNITSIDEVNKVFEGFLIDDNNQRNIIRGSLTDTARTQGSSMNANITFTKIYKGRSMEHIGHLENTGDVLIIRGTYRDKRNQHEFTMIKPASHIFTSATADIYQQGQNGIQSQQIPGYMLHDHTFIFTWINDGFWKMVHTTNQGVTIKDGYLSNPGTTWKNTTSWTNVNPHFYYISNFQGSGKSNCSKIASRKVGFCLTPNGKDQNEGVIELHSQNHDNEDIREACLNKCLAYPNATGCEASWDQTYDSKWNRCVVHTLPVSGARYYPGHVCWTFKECVN